MSPAAVVATVPSGVPVSPRSRTIATSTGSAVMAVATIMKGTNDRPSAWPGSTSANVPWRSPTAPALSPAGTSSAAAATVAAARPPRRNCRASISYPATNMKSTMAIWESTDRKGSTSAGNSRPVRWPGSRPSRVGPMAMPATMWPMTAGCPQRRAAAPSSHETTTISATSPMTTVVISSVLTGQHPRSGNSPLRTGPPPGRSGAPSAFGSFH